MNRDTTSQPRAMTLWAEGKVQSTATAREDCFGAPPPPERDVCGMAGSVRTVFELERIARKLGALGSPAMDIGTRSPETSSHFIRWKPACHEKPPPPTGANG